LITDVSPARVMLGVLRAVGLATSSGDWTGTYNKMPSELPIKRVNVTTSTPIIHGKDPNGEHSLHYGVQVLVRAGLTEDAYVRAARIADRIARITPATAVVTTIGINQYKVTHGSVASGPVEMMTQEDKDAARFVVNLLFTMELV
jgi:hypothetical protein